MVTCRQGEREREGEGEGGREKEEGGEERKRGGEGERERGRKREGETLGGGRSDVGGVGVERGGVRTLVAKGAETEAGRKVVDSGASASMTGDRSHFRGIVRAVCVPVSGIGGQTLTATGVGRGVVSGMLDIQQLYFVPGLRDTLVSVSTLVDDGYKFVFDKVEGQNKMVVSKNGSEVLGVRVGSNGLYFMPDLVTGCVDGDEANPKALWEEDVEQGRVCEQGFVALKGVVGKNTYAGDISEADLLHERCGHVSWGNGKWAERLRKVYGRDIGNGHSIAKCEACMRSKMHRVISRLAPNRRARRPLERVHFDLSPGIPELGIHGGVDDYKGFLMIVDEFTEEWFVYLIRSKSEVAGLLKEFKVMAERHFAQPEGMGALVEADGAFKMAGMRSDGERVNVNKEVKEWCAQNGIRHEKSAPYSQWQNGVAERAIKTAWEGSEAMRKAAGAPRRYWPYSLMAFVHVRGRIAMGVDDRSPYEKWWDVDIPLERRMQHLRIWGCKCYAWVPKELRKKLEDRAKVCVHLGYAADTKGYVVQEVETGRVMVSACVVFDETARPFQEHGRLDMDGPAGDEDSDGVIVIDWERIFVYEPNGSDGVNDVVGDDGVRDSVEGAGDARDHDIEVGDAIDLVGVASGARRPRRVDGREMPVLEAPGLEPGLPDLGPNFVPRPAQLVRVPESGPIRYQLTNPKREGTLCHARYEEYKCARTVQEALEKGATKADLKWDAERGFCEFGDGISGLSAGVGDEWGVGYDMDVGKNGEVLMPVVDIEGLTQKMRMERKVRDEAMDAGTMRKIKARIELLALAAQVPPRWTNSWELRLRDHTGKPCTI